MHNSSQVDLVLLSLLLFLPAAGGVVLSLMPYSAQREQSGSWWPVKGFALTVALVTFGISLVFLINFRTGSALTPSCIGRCGAGSSWPIQFAQHAPWFTSLGINYFLGFDGLNIWMVVLCTGVMVLAIFAGCLMINRRVKGFFVLMLIAETGMLGVFLSWNLFLFYIFWEVMLVPAYFLVGMWGEKKRIYATTKFVIYTIFGSFIMLVGIFYLWATVPGHNLDVTNLIDHPIADGPQAWVFLAFMLALGIKAALFPFHSWAPDTYVEAPVPVAVLISAVMGKTATFTMLRFVLPVMPHAAHQFSGLIEILAIVGILYGATMALVQNDIKRVLAFSSISHMNIIVLGIFALDQQGLDGAILQMFNHAVVMAGLFFFVAMMYARSGTRRLDEMSGLAKAYPILAGFGLLLFLAAMDLPGLGSFAGEFTILIGVFVSNAWFAAIAGLVTIIAAWYMVRWFQGIFHGPVGAQAYIDTEDVGQSQLGSIYEYPVRGPRLGRDILKSEAALLLPVAAVIIWLGVIPKPYTDRTSPTVGRLSTVLSTSGTGTTGLASATIHPRSKQSAEDGLAAAVKQSPIVRSNSRSTRQ